MSDATPARTPAVEIAEAAPRAMVTLRGSLADPDLAAAVVSAAGVDVPPVLRRVAAGDRSVVWMGPDELLLCGPRDAATEMASALAGPDRLVVDMSDARAVFVLRGAGAREVLAKGAPVDLHREAFRPGDARRTRLGQVAAAFWLLEDPEETFELVCFRSVAEHVRLWLDVAARPGSLPGML